MQAHLVAQDFYSVVANMRGASPEEVASRVLSCPGLEGLQGPTIAPVYTKEGDESVAQHGYYATTICVRKKQLYRAVKELRKVRIPPPCVQPFLYLTVEAAVPRCQGAAEGTDPVPV